MDEPFKAGDLWAESIAANGISDTSSRLAREADQDLCAEIEERLNDYADVHGMTVAGVFATIFTVAAKLFVETNDDVDADEFEIRREALAVAFREFCSTWRDLPEEEH